MKALTILFVLASASLVNAQFWVVTESQSISSFWKITESQYSNAKICPVTKSPNCRCGCLITGICTCRLNQSQSSGINWEPVSYGQALDQGKPVLIYFTTPNCPPCNRLENEVFSHPGVISYLSQEFIPIKGDETLASRFGITHYPTLAIVNRSLVWKQVGFQPYTITLNFLKNR